MQLFISIITVFEVEAKLIKRCKIKGNGFYIKYTKNSIIDIIDHILWYIQINSKKV